jgi:hypothetical protein
MADGIEANATIMLDAVENFILLYALHLKRFCFYERELKVWIGMRCESRGCDESKKIF